MLGTHPLETSECMGPPSARPKSWGSFAPSNFILNENLVGSKPEGQRTVESEPGNLAATMRGGGSFRTNVARLLSARGYCFFALNAATCRCGAKSTCRCGAMKRPFLVKSLWIKLWNSAKRGCRNPGLVALRLFGAGVMQPGKRELLLYSE
jgi:hypothetical protein